MYCCNSVDKRLTSDAKVPLPELSFVLVKSILLIFKKTPPTHFMTDLLTGL